MRPFEADRRVSLVFRADLLNAEAADALLKDLEEPPPYAVVVLVADELGPLPETIRSRCQLVPFRRLSERAIRAEIDRRAPGLAPEHATALARVAAGRLDRVERLLDPEAARRRGRLRQLLADRKVEEPTLEGSEQHRGDSDRQAGQAGKRDPRGGLAAHGGRV
jgi:DNA polymerase-3 subunit delta'